MCFRKEEKRKTFQEKVLEETASLSHILLAAMFLGMFQWSNFWDFVIYFVVTGGVVLFANIIQFKRKGQNGFWL